MGFNYQIALESQPAGIQERANFDSVKLALPSAESSGDIAHGTGTTGL